MLKYVNPRNRNRHKSDASNMCTAVEGKYDKESRDSSVLNREHICTHARKGMIIKKTIFILIAWIFTVTNPV